MNENNNISVTIIASVYNEEESLLSFWEELYTNLIQLDIKSCEVIFVNDGSSDKSQELIDQIQSNSDRISVKYIEFSRNFGHEAAMIAGIDHSEADVNICLDSDLQHPPDMIKEMLEKFHEGYDIVNMVRDQRKDNGFFKNIFSRIFYKILNRFSEFRFEPNASDFFLISKRIADIVSNNFRERNRFLRGYIQIIGFNKITISYIAPKRKHGKSKYSYKRLLKLAEILGFVFMVFSIVLGVYSIFQFFFTNNPPSGYTTIVVFLSICFTFLYFLIGILSVYIGHTYDESKQRPIYIIKNAKIKNEK